MILPLMPEALQDPNPTRISDGVNARLPLPRKVLVKVHASNESLKHASHGWCTYLQDKG